MDIKMFISQNFHTHIALMLHFALWGPLIGGLTFMFFLKVGGSNLGMSKTTFIFLALPLSYLLGVIPAGVSGFMLGFFHPSSLSNAIGLAALISGFVMLLCIFMINRMDSTPNVFDLGLFAFVLLAAIAGAGAGFLNYRKSFI